MSALHEKEIERPGACPFLYLCPHFPPLVCRWQLLLRHPPCQLRRLLRVLLLLQLLAPSLVIPRLLVIRERLRVREVLPRLDAVKLSPAGELVVVLELVRRDVRNLRLLDLVLYLIRVFGAAAEPRLPFVLLDFGSGSLLSRVAAASHFGRVGMCGFEVLSKKRNVGCGSQGQRIDKARRGLSRCWKVQNRQRAATPVGAELENGRRRRTKKKREGVGAG
mmetsp:Transcript_56293/g.119689  ORF Transcript_56293/g.119689 Transcript_56293/m.119689 type:complete len:220 (+) Transcript_56293:168-827(+)